MDIALLALCLALLLAVGAVVLFVLVVVGIRSDDRRMNLVRRPRTCVERVARRVLGMHVASRPDDATPVPSSRQVGR